jgi:hypothetical protein
MVATSQFERFMDGLNPGSAIAEQEKVEDM